MRPGRRANHEPPVPVLPHGDHGASRMQLRRPCGCAQDASRQLRRPSRRRALPGPLSHPIGSHGQALRAALDTRAARIRPSQSRKLKHRRKRSGAASGHEFESLPTFAFPAARPAEPPVQHRTMEQGCSASDPLARSQPQQECRFSKALERQPMAAAEGKRLSKEFHSNKGRKNRLRSPIFIPFLSDYSCIINTLNDSWQARAK